MSVPTLPHGALVALATPVTDTGDLDVDGLHRLLDRVVAGGVAGVCPVGSTGEGMRLSVAQRRRVLTETRAHVGDALPVLPAASLSSLEAVRDELTGLATAGATAVLIAPPSYYPHDSAELIDAYTAIADTSDVPIVLYNIPVYAKTPVHIASVQQLARHERIVGIKDSSRDMEYLGQVLTAVEGAPDFTVYTGTDTLLLPSLLMGADGTIAASGNLVPELLVGVYTAARDGDLATAAKLQDQLSRVIYACRNGVAPAPWKAALDLAGVCGPACVPPAHPLPGPQRDQLAADLRALDVVDA